jgi:hypothetical protein
MQKYSENGYQRIKLISNMAPTKVNITKNVGEYCISYYLLSLNELYVHNFKASRARMFSVHVSISKGNIYISNT